MSAELNYINIGVASLDCITLIVALEEAMDYSISNGDARKLRVQSEKL